MSPTSKSPAHASLLLLTSTLMNEVGTSLSPSSSPHHLCVTSGRSLSSFPANPSQDQKVSVKHSGTSPWMGLECLLLVPLLGRRGNVGDEQQGETR